LTVIFPFWPACSFQASPGPDRSRTISVVIARGKHLFPFRTEPLSPSAPMVLGGQPPGRVGRRRSLTSKPPSGAAFVCGGRLRVGASPATLRIRNGGPPASSQLEPPRRRGAVLVWRSSAGASGPSTPRSARARRGNPRARRRGRGSASRFAADRRSRLPSHRRRGGPWPAPPSQAGEEIWIAGRLARDRTRPRSTARGHTRPAWRSRSRDRRR
jgi:hypothetical protein